MSDPLSTWLEKKQFLEVELAKASDASQKFKLRKDIEECNTEIAKLQNQQPSNETFKQIVSSYSNAFLRVHINQNELIPFLCVVAGQTVSSIEAKDTINKKMNILLTGPSGCGKSLLVRQIAQQSIKHFKIPIFIEAKYFDGNIWTLLDQETRLLGISLAKDLLDACRVLQKQILIVLDGYNECPETECDKLVRSLLAMQNDIVGILVTSQENFESLKPLNLEEVCVVEPSIEIKRLIATASMGTEIPSTLDPLLATVKSNLEASLIGKVGQEMANENNLFKLFDAYVRKRLQDSAQDGIRIITDIAKHFSDRLTFSLSIRDIDRLLGKTSTSILILENLFKANLLTKHVDKISFSHELFLNAFAAEAIIRYSDNDPDRILAMLALPKHSERKSLIVGAIDDIVLLNKVLEGITDYELIVSCVMGSCGRYPRQWAEERCKLILTLIKQEAQSIRFKIDEQAFMNISIETESFYKWEGQNEAVITALPLLLIQGKYLEEIFDILDAMDKSINTAFKALLREVQGTKIPLRSSLFANAYVFSKTAIAQICQTVYLNKHKNQPDFVVSFINKKFTTPNLSNGQLYFLIHCYIYTLDTAIIVSILPKLLHTHWQYAPYHLRLELIEIAGRCWEHSEADKQPLIQPLKELLAKEQHIFISNTITETLQKLGALSDDEVEHKNFLMEEIDNILNDPEDTNNWLTAYRIYSNIFMHTFAEVYCEVFSQLSGIQRKIFLTMALRGTDQSDIFNFCACIITDLADFRDTASGKYIEPWVVVPSKDSKNKFTAMDIFVSAHVVLGLLGYRLPSQLNRSDSATTNALQACGEILYWCNRTDMELGERKKKCLEAWNVLMSHELGASIDAIRLCGSSSKNIMSDLPNTEKNAFLISQVFPEKIVEVCRFSLLNRTIQQTHFHDNEQEKSNILKFAINQIGKHGSINDLPLLYTFVDDIYLGKDVIKAVKNLEAKLDL